MSKLVSRGGAVWPNALARILFAVLGGYVFTYSLTAALARLLPLARIDAAISATLLSFAVYTVFVLWVFARPLRQALWALPVMLVLLLIGFGPQWFAGGEV
ncbi:MAG: iron transporter [Pseudomonas sp.]|uniref:iron transporter n=1 Tax=Pseudomonas sp. TaxID=306 RepID=UPI003242AEAC